jgi:hypothetical protein
MKVDKLKSINNILHYRLRIVHKGKKFTYWKKVKGISGCDAGLFYAPYIPYFRNP